MLVKQEVLLHIPPQCANYNLCFRNVQISSREEADRWWKTSLKEINNDSPVWISQYVFRTDQALIFISFFVCFHTPKGHPSSVNLFDIKLKVYFAALQEKANGNVLNFSNLLHPSKVDAVQCTSQSHRYTNGCKELKKPGCWARNRKVQSGDRLLWLMGRLIRSIGWWSGNDTTIESWTVLDSFSHSLKLQVWVWLVVFICYPCDELVYPACPPKAPGIGSSPLRDLK